MRPVPDTIPIRVPPLPGEAIDSWVEAYARRLTCKVGELLGLAGIPALTKAAWASKPWTAGSNPRDFLALSALTGVTVADLNALTLARFDGTLVTLAPTAHSHGPARWWPHLTGSRFCPACLDETAGRWKLVWRLPWTFACVGHGLLLADTCHACHRRARADWTVQRPLATRPDQCRAPRLTQHLDEATRTREPGICGYPLAQTATIVLPEGGLVLPAARHLETLLGAGADAQNRAALITQLDNIYAISRSCLTARARSARGELPEVVAKVLAELGDSAGLADPSRSHLGPRGYEASTIAFAVTVAVGATKTGHLDPQFADWLARHEVRDTSRGGPVAMLNRWANADAGLQQAMLRAAGPRMRTIGRLRFQTDGPTPRPPADHDLARRAAQVPALFWPGWALRLNTGKHEGQALAFRAALSTLLVLTGSKAGLEQASTALGRIDVSSATRGKSLAWLTRDLKGENSKRDFLAVLCHVAAGLDAHGSPIDYARRRQLFLSVDLDLDLLRDHFDHVGLRLPSQGMLKLYRLRVVELLTGHHPQYRLTPGSTPIDQSQARSYEQATLRNTGAVSAHLEDQARRILQAAGIDEPISWEPPFAWAPELEWPGPHPDDLDIRKAWELLRAGQRPATVARAVSTSPKHVWVAALRHPEVAGPGPVSRGGMVKIPRSTLPSADQIRTGRDQGISLKDLSVQFGCSYTTIKRLAANYGIQFPPGCHRIFVIEPAWLRDQLEAQQRTLKEVSEELGIGSAHLAELARELNIGIRARGSQNCRHPLTPYGGPQAFTPDIWAAFKGRSGIQLVRRLLRATQHATLRQAATHIGISEANLHQQLNVLERRVGTQLLERAAGKRTLSLTPSGQAFACNARQVLKLLADPPPALESHGPEAIRWQRQGSVAPNASVDRYCMEPAGCADEPAGSSMLHKDSIRTDGGFPATNDMGNAVPAVLCAQPPAHQANSRR
jgi:TniQ/Bacterial regulatory helix-turn-helix protein, lysR family